MADNTVLNAAQIAGGDLLASDDIGGSPAVKVPRVKMMLGADGANDGDVSAANPLPVKLPSAGSGVYHRVSTGDNNAMNVQVGPVNVFGVHVYNNAGYPVYVKLFDKASAPDPTVDTPKRTIGVQAGIPRDLDIPNGMLFTLGLGIAIVKGLTDHDNTSVLANDCVVDVDYK